MLKNKWLPRITFGAFLSTLLLFSGKAAAQVRISPIVIEAKTNNGQAQSTISITNTSNAPTRVRIYAEPFTYNRDTGFQTIKSNPADLTPYLQFSPRELTINPGETRRVRLISRLAPNLPEGEYRAVVFNETLKESNDDLGNKIGVLTRLGVTLYVRKGNLSPQPVVESASFNPQKQQIQLLLRNTGKATALTKINWNLRSGATSVKTGQIELGVIMAEGEDKLSLNYPDKEKLAPGQYQLTGELVWQEDTNKKQLPFNVNITVPNQNTAPKVK